MVIKSRLVLMAWFKFSIMITLFFFGQGCSSRTPLEKHQRELVRYPEYSIILEDMKEEGNFFTDYYHRYKLTYSEKGGAEDNPVFNSQITDWYKVDDKEYEKYLNFLGMVILSKSRDGKVTDARYPPGYQNVGDSRYGQWQTDRGGNSFWEFYGKYALMSQVFGMFNRPVYRNDWDRYRDSRGRGTPYYGANREYGTNGSRTKQTNKNFFDRRVQKEQQRKARFSERAKQRVRRSRMSGMRRRSGGFGK